MTLIGRVEVESPLLREALAGVPAMRLQLEDVRQAPDEPRKLVGWASGNDFETFEAGLTTDPTVADYRYLTDLRDQRLYRITLSKTGHQKSVYAVFVEHDIIILDAAFTAAGIDTLARFPTREAVITLREACAENEIPFRLKQLYREAPTANDGGTISPYGVTDAQREALLYALKAGYFDVPRQTKMAAMAEELGISTTALSTRLRRGQRNLLHETLAEEPPI